MKRHGACRALGLRVAMEVLWSVGDLRGRSRHKGSTLASASELPHHLYRRGARGEVGVCRVYFLTTYREEELVGKLVCRVYFLTTYREERLVGKLIKTSAY